MCTLQYLMHWRIIKEQKQQNRQKAAKSKQNGQHSRREEQRAIEEGNEKKNP